MPIDYGINLYFFFSIVEADSVSALIFIVFFSPLLLIHVSKIFETSPKAREMKYPERCDDPSNPQVFIL